MSSLSFGEKIVDKLGFTVPFFLAGILLPLAAWGGSALLSYSLAHLGAASVFIGALTWSNIWPIMLIATLSLLVIGIIIDVGRSIAGAVKKAKIKKKGLENDKENEKSVAKNKEKGKLVNINKGFDKAVKNGCKKKMITASGNKMIKLDDRNRTKVYNNKDKVNITNKNVDKKKYLKRDKVAVSK